MANLARHSSGSCFKVSGGETSLLSISAPPVERYDSPWISTKHVDDEPSKSKLPLISIFSFPNFRNIRFTLRCYPRAINNFRGVIFENNFANDVIDDRIDSFSFVMMIYIYIAKNNRTREYVKISLISVQ